MNALISIKKHFQLSKQCCRQFCRLLLKDWVQDRQFVLKRSDFLITYEDRHDRGPLETQTSLSISACTHVYIR